MNEEAENQEENLAPPAPAIDLPGKRLRESRETAQMSKDEVASHLHLDVSLIDALEKDDFEKLPSAAYICGYLRSYARLMKLPEKEIVDAYSHGQEINAALIPENVDIVPRRENASKMIRMIAILIVVVFVAAGAMWLAERFKLLEHLSGEDAEVSQIEMDISSVATEGNKQIISEPLVISEQQRPEEIVVDAPPVEAEIEEVYADSSLQLVVNETSWIEVYDATGERLIYQQATTDSKLGVDGEPPFTILLGYAPGVEVFYNGEKFDHSRYLRAEKNVAYFKLGFRP